MLLYRRILIYRNNVETVDINLKQHYVTFSP